MPSGEQNNVSSLEIGPISIDYNAKYKTDNAPPSAVWTDYMVKNRYKGDEHVYMMSITSPDGFAGQKAAFVQLAAPTLLWVCEWTACRFDVPPTVPSFQPPNRYWVLLDKHLEPGMIGLGPDGVSPIYRLNGTYTYGCSDPDKVLLSFPKPPWMDDSVDRGLTANQFQMGISDVQQGIGTTGISTPSPGRA